jgi:hypothetical protein
MSLFHQIYGMNSLSYLKWFDYLNQTPDSVKFEMKARERK